MKYGYARVSTDGQSVDAQVRQLKALRAEHARLLVYLDHVGSYGMAGFDEGEILKTIDRLHEIEVALPLEFPNLSPDPDEVPF